MLSLLLECLLNRNIGISIKNYLSWLELKTFSMKQLKSIIATTIGFSLCIAWGFFMLLFSDAASLQLMGAGLIVYGLVWLALLFRSLSKEDENAEDQE